MGDVASRRLMVRAPLFSVLLAGIALSGLAAPGCGSSGTEARPAPVLIFNPQLEHRYAELTRRFDGANTKERIALEPDIQALRDARPGTSAERALDALLSWVALEKAQLDRAHQLAASVEAGPPGTTRDLAQVVLGAVLRRRGESQKALAKLEPLVNKVIDPRVRELLNREVVDAALEAEEWDAALDHMNDWLRDAVEENRDEIGVKIRAGLEAVPPEPLVEFLEEHSTDEEGDRGAAGTVGRLAAQQLAERAKTAGDVELARRLLSDWRHLLGAEGDSVAQLAVGQMVARVQTRTVGLLLSMGDRDLRRRGIEVATGLADGLGGIDSSFRMVTRDDAGDPERIPAALEQLAAQGASLLVAGLDEASATVVAGLARKQSIPILLLRPAKGPSSPFVFQLGEDPDDVVSTLSARLTDAGANRISVMGEVGSACGVTPWGAGAAPGNSAGRGLIVVAGLRCAKDASKSYGASARLGFGLDAASAAGPGDWVARAGYFPLDVSREKNAPLPPSVTGFRDARGRLPTWWEALGRDAGVVARAALSPMADETVEVPAKLRSRRAEIAEALATAQVELWTTKARGFGGARVMPRTLSVHRVP